jgi:crotonobetainyl-CoA:carnitine CoA-transferase CaiB-like acyl-CoA transferase
MPGPLTGIRVVELTSVVLGPWACQILADMGADVIKVEPPAGDSNRQLGMARHKGMAALYLTCNRNKRSIALDVKQPAGREAVLDLVRTADVFIHNNRPQVMTKLGLDYDVLKAATRCQYCGSYGYARKGPGSKGALDDSIQSIAGVAMLNKLLPASRVTSRPSLRQDHSVTVVYGVLAALFARAQRPRAGSAGANVRTMVSTSWPSTCGATFEPPSARQATPHDIHRRPYPTRDGYVAILPYMNAHWDGLCGHGPSGWTTAFPHHGRSNPQHRRYLRRDGADHRDAHDLSGSTCSHRPACRQSRQFARDLADDPHLVATGFWKTCSTRRGTPHHGVR